MGNKKPIKSDKTYDISYNKGVATLKLAKALPVNSGEYSVELKNPFGSANSMASLTVQAKPKGEAPKITQPLASKNVKDGEKVELVAKITGTEPLDVQWTFDKKPIKSDRIHMITYFKGTASLKLSRAVPRNSGEYSVLVRNQYGSADSMASVKVQEIKEEPKAAPKKQDEKPPIVEEQMVMKKEEPKKNAPPKEIAEEPMMKKKEEPKKNAPPKEIAEEPMMKKKE